MRLFIFVISFLFSIASFSQDTVDVATDSLHRQRLMNSTVGRLQCWTPNKTWTYENISYVRTMTDSFEVEVDHVHIPFEGYMTSRYGNRHGGWHPGVDIALRVGDTVRSAWSGVVRYAMMNRGGYGNLVIVRHRNGLETYYAHLSAIKVVSGQAVKAGDLLGLGGNTGHSFGPHLHFEIRFYDVTINPEFVVDFAEKEVHSSSLVVGPKLLKGISPPIPASTIFDEFESIEFVAGVILPAHLGSKSSTPVEQRKYYRVRKGDCLNKVAERNGTSVFELCRLNRIDELKFLMVGQMLRIK